MSASPAPKGLLRWALVLEKTLGARPTLIAHRSSPHHRFFTDQRSAISNQRLIIDQRLISA